MSSRAPLRRTETAVVVVVGRVQAAAALLMHRAPGCRGRHARCQQGGHAQLFTQLQHDQWFRSLFAFRQGENKDRCPVARCNREVSVIPLQPLYLVACIVR